MGWGLPTTVEVAGQTFAIRSDYRAVLDAIDALQDEELPQAWRLSTCLKILFPEYEKLSEVGAEAALRAAMEFINLGRPLPENQPERIALVHWDTDVQLIAPAVDKVLGYSCRACAYLHWWDFVGAFQNIGKGLFAQVVAIRDKRARGQALDKAERAFARENEELIGPVTRLTKEEEEFFRRMGV